MVAVTLLTLIPLAALEIFGAMVAVNSRPLWQGGLIGALLAAIIQPGLCLAAFFIATTFFAP